MSEPFIVRPADDGVAEVSRHNLRHLIVRRRNERIAELRDDRWPLAIYCHRDTLEELRVDNDPREVDTLRGFEAADFMGIPLVGTYTDEESVAPGEFRVVWPSGAVAAKPEEPADG